MIQQAEPSAATGQRGSPPSTYAALAFLEGQNGAWGQLAFVTLQRMVLIAPGLYAAGIRGRDFWRGTVGASLGITTGMILYYALRRRNGESFR